MLDSPLAIIELGFAVLSATILVGYLVFRPPLVRATKIWLLLGLGVFPFRPRSPGTSKGSRRRKSARSAVRAT